MQECYVQVLLLNLDAKLQGKSKHCLFKECSHTGGCVSPVVVWVDSVCDRPWALCLSIFFTGVHGAEEGWNLLKTEDVKKKSWHFHVLLLPTASHSLKTGRLIGDSKLLQGVNCCQSPCDWLPVQGNPRLSPSVSWKRLQPPWPSRITANN